MRSKKVNSADQIGQLDDLRFKTQMDRKNLSRERKSMKIWKMKCAVWGNKFRRGPIPNMAIPPWKLKLAQLGSTGPFANSIWEYT